MGNLSNIVGKFKLDPPSQYFFHATPLAMSILWCWNALRVGSFQSYKREHTIYLIHKIVKSVLGWHFVTPKPSKLLQKLAKIKVTPGSGAWYFPPDWGAEQYFGHRGAQMLNPVALYTNLKMLVCHVTIR